MAYVPKPETGTKVLKMTLPWNGSASIALTPEKQKQSLSEVLVVFRRATFRGGYQKKNFV